MNLFEKLNRLDDSLLESNRAVKKKKLTESIEDVDRRKEFLKEVFTEEEIIDLAEAHTDFTGKTYKEAFNYVLNNWDKFYFEDEYEAFCEEDLDDDIDEMLKESIEYEVYMDSGVTDEDEFFTDLRKAKSFAKQLAKKYGKLDHDASAIIKMSNGDSLPDNWPIIHKIRYDSSADEFKLYNEEVLTEGYSNEMTEFMNWIQEYRNGALWDDFSAEFESEQDPDISIVLTWLENFDEDAYYDYVAADTYDDIDEMLTENTLTNYLPPSVDNMLMDMAQMCGEFDYADVYRFTKAGVDDDIVRKLKNLYRRWNKAAEYNDEEKMCILAKEAAQIIGKVSLTENRNNPYFTPFGYRDAAKVINRKAPEYYYHLKEIEMDKGDGVKLARYALRKGLPVMVDKNSDPDYPKFAIKGEYHWNDYFYPYPTAHEEDLVDWDGKMFVEEQLMESCEYTVKRYGEWHWGIIGPDKLMVRQDNGKLLLFKSKDQAVAYIDTLCKNTLTEALKGPGYAIKVWENPESVKKGMPAFDSIKKHKLYPDFDAVIKALQSSELSELGAYEILWVKSGEEL